MSTNYRKFIAGTVSAAVVASAIAPVASAASFSDVDANSVHAKAIDALSETGIINGYPDGTFKPGKSITRGQAAKMIARTIEGEGKVEQVFTDVPATADEELVKAAYEVFTAGAMTGANGQLLPNKEITRQQMAKVLVEAFNLEHSDAFENNLKDLNTAYADFQDYIEILVENGVTQVADGNFRPLEPVSRAQFATFVYRILEAQKLEITDVEKLADVKVMEGEKAELPETVEVTYSNGSKKDVAVKWDAVDTSKVGTQTVEGTIEGTDKKATVKVVVEAATPEVKEVKAINANEIQVVFSSKVDEDSAETIANYAVKKGSALEEVADVELQEDGKTAIVKLSGLLTNKTAYTVEVQDVEFANGKSLEEKAVMPLFFVDEAKPTVLSAKAEENGDVTVTFSERLDTEAVPTIVINGQSISADYITVNDDATVTIEKAGLPTLENGKAYSLVVSEAADLVNNKMSLYSGSFAYSVEVVAPQVKSITAKDEDTVVVEFNKELAAALVNGSTLKVVKGTTAVTPAIVAVDGETNKFELNFAPSIYSEGQDTATLKVTVEGYKDTLNNVGTKVEQEVTISKDLVKPAVEKSEYKAATNTLELTFNKEVTEKDAAKLYIMDKNGVRYAVEDADVTVVDKKATVALNSVDVTEDGDYTLHIAAGAFADTTISENENAAKAIDFKVADAAETAKPTAQVAAGAENGTVQVTFSEAVKGGSVAGSATDAANYKLDGANLPEGTQISLNSARTVATIVLPKGSVETTKTSVFTVADVQDLAGNVMDTVNSTVTVTENKAPALTSAKIDGSHIVLTFSENVDTAEDLDFSDFEVKVNGVDATEAAKADTYTKSVEKNQLVINVTDVNLATGTVDVKVLDAADATDAAGNAIVKGTKVTATR
ncbi:S-layer homology domain-containing protein [Bacillus songklensis]|uniref:S-layer homology domain-containing protein n=1 Tax=Bacillus songklensis TaxID=1069116 RepID=A0ABV8BAJ5_9BACI